LPARRGGVTGPAPLGPEGFARETDVSRETLERLSLYLSLLERWQARINLVARSTLADPWRRHILDSAQLWPHLPAEAGTLVDLGSGAGFPGLVLAILAAGEGRALAVHLVESDARKAAFLAEAASALGLRAPRVQVHARRAEDLGRSGTLPAEIVTARALTALPELIDLALPFLPAGGTCLLLKGARWQEELTALGDRAKMLAAHLPSRTDPAGAILSFRVPRP